jgi:uncharacterized membrane protein
MTTNTETHALPAPKTIDPVAAGLLGGFFFCLALAAVQLKTLAGLPAHPLLLHVPVVLVPVLSGAAIALMVRPDWRRRYGVAAALLALVALAFTILAAGAGEAFRASRAIFASPALNEHAELGDQLKAVMVVFAGSLVGLVAADQMRGPGTLARLARILHRPQIERLVRIGIAALAAIALVWVVRTGHEGAKVAWEQPSPLHAAQSH